MSTRPDPSAPEAPQEAVDGPQGGLEGASGQRETPRGENGVQVDAQRFQNEPQPRGPVDWARHYAAERETQPEKRLHLAHQARRAKEHQLDDIRRALCDIGFMQDDDPYSHADLADVIRQNGQALRDTAQPAPAHNAGPSIRECADQDARHGNDKDAGEGQ